MSKQPETSKEAKALKTEESKQRDYDAIIEAYMALGKANYDQVAKWLQWDDRNAVSRRLSEMRELGWLERTEEKTMTSRNCPAFVHKLVDGWNKTVVKSRIPKKENPPTNKIPVKAHFRTIKKENLNTGQQNLFDL